MITYATLTNIGSKAVNENSVGVVSHGNSYCFTLCEGSGSKNNGDIAANLVKDVFCNIFEQYETPEEFLSEVFHVSHDFLIAEQLERREKYKLTTSCLCLVLDGHNAYVGVNGNLRLYEFKRNRIKKVIRQEKDEFINKQAIGCECDSIQYLIEEPTEYKNKHSFLLCTNDFFDYIDEKTVRLLLKKSDSPEHWLSEMERVIIANSSGKSLSDYSAIAVWVRK